MEEFLEYVARQIVTKPNDVHVEAEETERGTVLKLTVAQEDMGKIIGKDGKVAKALRTVVKAAARNSETPVFIDII